MLRDCAAALGRVADAVAAEGVLADRTRPEAAAAEERLATEFRAARFHLATERAAGAVDGGFEDRLKRAEAPAAADVAVVQAVMYILGHQQRDVSDWPKCRRLLTHHLLKEMRMIDVRGPRLKVHKLRLARECVGGLGLGEVRAAGPSTQALWKWVRMVLEVQDLE